MLARTGECENESDSRLWKIEMDSAGCRNRVAAFPNPTVCVAGAGANSPCSARFVRTFRHQSDMPVAGMQCRAQPRRPAGTVVPGDFPVHLESGDCVIEAQPAARHC